MNPRRLLVICFARRRFLVFPIWILPGTRWSQQAVRKRSLALIPSPNQHWPVSHWRHWKPISDLLSIIIPRSPPYLHCCSCHLLLSRLLYYWITMQKRISPEVLDWIFSRFKKCPLLMSCVGSLCLGWPVFVALPIALPRYYLKYDLICLELPFGNYWYIYNVRTKATVAHITAALNG